MIQPLCKVRYRERQAILQRTQQSRNLLLSEHEDRMVLRTGRFRRDEINMERRDGFVYHRKIHLKNRMRVPRNWERLTNCPNQGRRFKDTDPAVRSLHCQNCGIKLRTTTRTWRGAKPKYRIITTLTRCAWRSHCKAGRKSAAGPGAHGKCSYLLGIPAS